MPRPIPVGRPAPDWLVDQSFEDRSLGVLKSGKEAEVFLVERRYETATCLLAHKRFRPRHPKKGELRELGFSKGTIYRSDRVYRQGWHLKARVGEWFARRGAPIDVEAEFGELVVGLLF